MPSKEVALKNSIREIFEQVPTLRCDEKDYALLTLLLKEGPMNRRRLLKQVKDKGWGKTLVYERVKRLYNRGFLKVIRERPAIKGKEIVYDLSFRGLLLAITDEDVSFSPQLLKRLRKELHIPAFYNSLEYVATLNAPEGEPRFVRYDIRDEAVTGMIKVWAKYCLSDPLLRTTTCFTLWTWEDLTSMFMSAINRLVDNFYWKGVPLEEQLLKLGLEPAEAEAIMPLIQHLFVQANQVRLLQVTRIITAVRKASGFMPSPMTCLPIGPVVYYIGVGELANAFEVSRNLILATISRKKPDTKAIADVKPVYYVFAECMFRQPDGFCQRTKKRCPYGNYVQSLGKCSFIRRALRKELSKFPYKPPS